MSESAIADVRVKVVEEGDLTPARALLSPRQFVLATADDTRTIPLPGIEDVTAGYVPEGASDLLEDAMTVSYERDGATRRLVLQAPREKLEPFVTLLFTALLSGATVRVKHPAREGGRTTDAAPREAAVTVHDWGVEFARQGRTFAIRQAEVIGLDRTERQFDGDRRPAIVVDHRRGEVAVTTEIAGPDRRRLNLLGRYLAIDYRSVLGEIRDIEVTEAELEALVGLYTTGGDAAIERLVTAGPADGLVDGLRKKELLTGEGDLTRLGRALISNRIEEIDT